MEFAGVNAAPASTKPDRVLEMQHFVVNDVFDRITWYREMIEDAADDNGIVRRIVVA